MGEGTMEIIISQDARKGQARGSNGHQIMCVFIVCAMAIQLVVVYQKTNG